MIALYIPYGSDKFSEFFQHGYMFFLTNSGKILFLQSNKLLSIHFGMDIIYR